MKFKSNIELQSGLEDNNATSGTSGQVLSSTGTGVEWIDQSAITEAKSNFVYFDVKNETGSTINKGKGVMAVGTDGNSGHILIDEMAADGSIEPKYFLGVLETTVANGGFARVISFGQLDQFNTNGQNGETWNDGNILWCDPDSAGDFTITEPDGPNVKIAAAIVLNASTNGKIQVRVQANEGIHDLHDTKIVTQTDGDVLVWKDEDSVWQNDSTLNVDYTNGRVGIGTTSPSTTLDVVGTTNSTYFTTGGAEIYGDTFSGLNLRCPSGIANDFSLVGSAGIGPNIMTVPAATTNVIFYGNVGINTTNPTERLEVSGNVITTGNFTATGKGFFGGSTITSGILNLKLSTNNNILLRDSGGVSLIDSVNDANTATRPLEFQGSSYKFRGTSTVITVQGTITSQGTSNNSFAGNVGIGTTSPDSKLEVASTDTNTYLHIRNDSTGSTRLKMSNLSDTNSNGFQIINNGSNGQVNLLNYKASTLALWTNSLQRMTILSGGNVGIGTTSPQAKLHVANGTLRTWTPTSGTSAIFESTASSRSFVTITGANESELWFGDGTTQAKGRVRYENNNNTMELWTNAVPRVNIDSSGNVGIGTTSPSEKLDVNGDVNSDFYRSNSDISTSTVAFNATNTTGGNLNYTVTNNRLICTGVFNSSLTAIGFLTIATLPTGARPNINRRAVIIDNAGFALAVVITTNGELKMTLKPISLYEIDFEITLDLTQV